MNTQSLLPLAILVVIGLPLSILVARGLCQLRPASQRAAHVAALKANLWLHYLGFGVAPVLAIISLFAPNPGIDTLPEGVVIGIVAAVLLGFTTYGRSKPPDPTDSPDAEEARP